MDRNKIFKLIETIVESKSIVSSQISDSNIGNLVPIEEVYGGYMCDRAIQFTPHEDYGKGGELVKADLTDDKIRLEELTKLNNQITKYNKWVEKKNVLYKKEFDAKISKLNMKTGVTYTFEHHNLNIKRNEYFPLPYFEMWSFMVERNLPQQTNTFTNIKNSILNINDEELYKLKDTDPDFVVRINKTIAEYIHGEIREALDKNRSIEESVWNEPNNRFGNWLSQHPSDAESYFEEIADCDIGVSIDGEHRNAVHMVKKLTKQNKALKIHRHKPNQVEMQETIDKNRFKNDKCNNTKVGSDLGVDPETAKRWIEKLGLSDYAYNPHHLK